MQAQAPVLELLTDFSLVVVGCSQGLLHYCISSNGGNEVHVHSLQVNIVPVLYLVHRGDWNGLQVDIVYPHKRWHSRWKLSQELKWK